jgi:cytochrome P450
MSKRASLGFTRRVLAESLRLRPPSWVLARTAVEDCELRGVPIPAGSVVLISQHVLHRDPRYFPNPEAFDPDRWLDERQAGRSKMAYIPFGSGPRACIGEGFAWMEGVLLLATFAQRWRLRLYDMTEPIRPQPKITLRPPALSMIVEARRVRP